MINYCDNIIIISSNKQNAISMKKYMNYELSSMHPYYKQCKKHNIKFKNQIKILEQNFSL